MTMAKKAAEMNVQATITVTVAGFALLLGGCMSPPSLGPGEVDFGNAVQHNMQTQVVNPDPRPLAGPPPYSGVRAALGMNRYKSDDVKEPRRLRTATILKSTGN